MHLSATPAAWCAFYSFFGQSFVDRGKAVTFPPFEKSHCLISFACDQSK